MWTTAVRSSVTVVVDGMLAPWNVRRTEKQRLPGSVGGATRILIGSARATRWPEHWSSRRGSGRGPALPPTHLPLGGNIVGVGVFARDAPVPYGDDVHPIGRERPAVHRARHDV